MDLNAIKRKLESFQKTTPNGGNNNNRRFKPSVGKQTVRVVPFKYNKDYPFTEMKFYYGIGSRRVIASPLNWNEKDPIAEFAKQLRGTNDRENWRLAKKLEPKMRVFAPVVVRGEENKGVRFWEFGKQVYQELLSYAADEDYGDFTDVVSGLDMTVEVVQGNPYPETSVRIKPKQTALSDNNDQVDSWLKTQPNPVEVHTQYDYEFIKKQLQNYLNPGSAEESTPAQTKTDDKLPESLGQQKTDFTLETATAGNKDTVSKFDDLFNE